MLNVVYNTFKRVTIGIHLSTGALGPRHGEVRRAH